VSRLRAKWSGFARALRARTRLHSENLIAKVCPGARSFCSLFFVPRIRTDQKKDCLLETGGIAVRLKQ
jgi:hypothetical protein